MIFFILAVYVVAYLYIIFKSDTASITTFIFGLLSVLLLGAFDFESVSKIVDFNTLFILIGMMIMVSVLKRRGVFSEISRILIKMSKGNFLALIMLICVGIFFLSAFLDNVTTIIIFVPILFYIAESLELDPKPLLTNAILFSNLGGMTTAIGDPPNIVIYSISKLSFISFITHLMPPGILIMLLQLYFLSKNIRYPRTGIGINIEASKSSENRKWLYYFIAFAGVVLFMSFHEVLGLELGVISIIYAFAILFVENMNLHSVGDDIEWDSIFLISGLYLLNYSIEQINITKPLLTVLSPLANSVFLPLIILWSSIFASGFLSALPVTLLYLSVIKSLIKLGAGNELYWALALGIGVGGNLTPISSMCNIVGNNLFRNMKNETLSFKEFTKRMLKPVLSGGIISSVFLIVFWWFGI
ncbi:MAG: SLC13 family permease [Fervidobacterium sp.]|uniref:ArsB/NhaD family transporter n=1 Tax=Fervidobacterium sp. TaxID=1871331 RepID=UPI00404B6DDE